MKCKLVANSMDENINLLALQPNVSMAFDAHNVISAELEKPKLRLGNSFAEYVCLFIKGDLELPTVLLYFSKRCELSVFDISCSIEAGPKIKEQLPIFHQGAVHTSVITKNFR